MEPFNKNEQADRLREFIRFFGLAETAVRFGKASDWAGAWDNADATDGTPRVIELPAKESMARPEWQDFIPPSAPHGDIFIFGAQTRPPDPEQKSPERDTARTCEIQFSNDRHWSALQGLTTEWELCLRPFRPPDFVSSAGWRPLLTINGTPWFLERRSEHGTVFLWIGPELPVIRSPLRRAELFNPERLLTHLLGVLPIMFFFRHAFGARIWHSPVNFANLIIDDPPVRDHYGFFSPARYLDALQDLPSATTVGFIPWYFRRSTASAAEIFRSNQGRLSLCVHGCDHTDKEFGSSDQARLTAKCRLALQRMEQLRLLTGVPCAAVMVFPQGHFSKAAVAALQETGFLAAIDSTRLPVDLNDGEISISNLLQPAVTIYGGFPLFRRRYPRDVSISALDLFIGRPALFVEHHGYFRDDHVACRQFVSGLNKLPGSVVWAPVEHIVSRACLQRELSPGTYEVLYYTREFILENRSDETRTYLLKKHEPLTELIESVLVDGKPTDYAHGDARLSLSLTLPPHAAVTVRVKVNAPVYPSPPSAGSLPYRAGVWVRRSLCEIRDNNPWLFHLNQLLRGGHSRRGNV